MWYVDIIVNSILNSKSIRLELIKLIHFIQEHLILILNRYIVVNLVIFISYMRETVTFKKEVTHGKWYTATWIHRGCSSPSSKYECVTLVWPMWTLAKTISSFPMLRAPLIVLSQNDLFLILLFHELWAFIKDIRYLLIDGLKLEKES